MTLEPQQSSNKRAMSLIGQVVALLLALLCLVNSAVCLYSAMYSVGSGEYAGMGLVFAFVINVPLCLIALLLAVLLRPANPKLRAATVVITIVAFGLPFAEPGIRKSRSERHMKELMRQLEAQKPTEP